MVGIFHLLPYDCSHMATKPTCALDWESLTQTQPTLDCIPDELRRHAELRPLAQGDVLFRIGDRVLSVLCVVSGEVRLVRRDLRGKEIVLQRSRGGFLAEASLNSPAYHCDVVVAGKGEILRFPAREFQKALDDNQTFRNAWLQHLAREVRRLRGQCERMNLRSATERILHYIDAEGSNGAISLSQSRKTWASELGLTHEALYRALSRLQTDGSLLVSGSEIAVISCK